MSRSVWVAAALLAAIGLVDRANAQSPTQPAPTPPTAAPAIATGTPKSAPADGDRSVKTAPTSAAPAKAAPTTKPADAQKSADAKKPIAAVGKPGCTRLPLSDIQFTEEKTIEVARMRLGEYAQKVATQRGWKNFRKSDETVSCEVYLYLGPLGTEYKCLVTATFCPGPAITTAAKPPAAAKLPSLASTPATTPVAAPTPTALAKPAAPATALPPTTAKAPAPPAATPKAVP